MTEIHLTGRAASPGLAIGPLAVLNVAVERRTASGDPAQEAAALQAAIEAAAAGLSGLMETVHGEAADILGFQVAMMEDDPCFNAGTGACLNADGLIELDAALMEGTQLKAGGVCALPSAGRWSENHLRSAIPCRPPVTTRKCASSRVVACLRTAS